MKTGIGLRTGMHADILMEKPNVGFLEAHAENYFGATPFRHDLLKIRNDYDISLHGVGLSLGRADDLDEDHLKKLKQLVNEVEPLFISEHLAWSAYSHRHLPDLLPLPLTDQAITCMCQHVDAMQEYLQRQVFIENPSNYLAFDVLQIDEPDFLNQLAQKTGCGILLDVNNVYISAFNLHRDAERYIHHLDTRHICQYHLAGHKEQTVQKERVLIDSHNQTVSSKVWDLYEKTLQRHGDRPTLFEWDSELPSLPVLLSEARKADELRESTQQLNTVIDVQSPPYYCSQNNKRLKDLSTMQSLFIDNVLLLETKNVIKSDSIKRLNIYTNNTFFGVLNYLKSVFPVSQHYVDPMLMKQVCRDCVMKTPPFCGNLHEYGEIFKTALKSFVGSDLIFNERPFLTDLIDLEWEKHRVFFTETETKPRFYVSPKIDESMFLNYPIFLSTNVSVLRSDFPLFEIYSQRLPQSLNNVNVVGGDGFESVLVYKNKKKQRPKINVTKIEEPLFNLLNSAKEGVFLFELLNRLSESFESESLSRALAFAVKNELFVMNQRPENE